jgi:hypothetical protein
MSSLLNLKQEHRKGFLYRILQPLMMTIQLQRNPMDQLLMRTHHQRMAVYQLVMTIFSSVVRLWLSLHCVNFLLGGLSVLFVCVLCGFRIIAETKMISFLCMLIWFWLMIRYSFAIEELSLHSLDRILIVVHIAAFVLLSFYC